MEDKIKNLLKFIGAMVGLVILGKFIVQYNVSYLLFITLVGWLGYKYVKSLPKWEKNKEVM